MSGGWDPVAGAGGAVPEPPVAPSHPAPPPFPGVAFDEADADDAELIRPFVITGGRTRHATLHLRVETLVAATGRTDDRTLLFEHAAVLDACASPVSVAEVAARVGVPLGVAQILVGDLAEAGLVEVHESRAVVTPSLLLRMIDAVRAL